MFLCPKWWNAGSLIICILFIASCKNKSSMISSGYLSFYADPGKEILIYSVEDKSQKITPLMRLKANTKVKLPVGTYKLANQCSEFNIHLESEKEFKVFLNKLNFLKKSNKTSDSSYFSLECFDPISRKDVIFHDIDFVDLLPGKNTLFISGKEYSVNISNQEKQDINLQLSSVYVRTIINNKLDHFFVTSKNDNVLKKNAQKTVSAIVNGEIWLMPGHYLFEINGTAKEIEVNNIKNEMLDLGVLKIASAKNFPLEERLHLGGQPIFAQISDKTLFILDTEYPVFPGEYNITLDSSEIKTHAEIKPHTETILQTYAARINAPRCTSTSKDSCSKPVRITVHLNRLPYILMSVPLDMPFLVFNEPYQYCVDGVKGIFKSLQKSDIGLKSERLGRIKINWETRYTRSNIKTDFVRFETKSLDAFGKSTDLLFYKPEEVFLPEGDYWLSYLTGELGTSTVSKTKIDLKIIDGNTRVVSVLVYKHQDQPDNDTISINNKDSNNGLQLIHK